MMDDLIFRRAAIDAMCDNCGTVDAVCPHYPCARYEAVLELPSAQQWIPCSERLPEENKEVLISTKCYSLYLGAIEFFDDLTRWYDTQEYMEIRGVTAWMPLPEPYKQEENQ